MQPFIYDKRIIDKYVEQNNLQNKIETIIIDEKRSRFTIVFNESSRLLNKT